MAKVVCIYHKNCFDGICAAWVTNKRFPGCELRPMTYGEEFPFNEYGGVDRIFIVDFSFPRDIMLAIRNQVESLFVIDHHKTAQANCEGLDFCLFDMNESGASLAWKYFFPNHSLPNLVAYIADRDIWKFALPSSEEVNAYIQSFPMDINQYEFLYEDLEQRIEIAINGGVSINRYKNQLVEQIIKNYTMQDILGHTVPVVNCPVLMSEVGHALAKLNVGPFGAYYFDRKDGMTQWGARSIGEFDVSEIAKKLGGGGHKNAAGWQA